MPNTQRAHRRVLRRTVDDDLDRLLAIANRSIAVSAANFNVHPERLEDWREALAAAADRLPWLTLVCDGVAAGYARAFPFKSRCAYAWTVETSIYLDESARGAGSGRALYDALLRTLAAQGFRSAIGVVSHPNPVSEALHRRCGFRLQGTIAAVGWKFGRWWDVGYWQHDLGRTPETTPAEPLPVSAVWRDLLLD